MSAIPIRCTYSRSVPTGICCCRTRIPCLLWAEVSGAWREIGGGYHFHTYHQRLKGRFEMSEEHEEPMKLASSEEKGVENKSPGGYFSNLAQLRLNPDHASSIGVKRLLTHVPVRRPDRQWFVRVHPDADYRLDAGLLEFRDEGEIYFVDPALHLELSGELTYKTLFMAINRQGLPFLWHVRLPDEDGRIDDWNRVAREAAEMAIDRWIKLASNRALGSYELSEAVGQLPEPDWPEETMEQLLEVAFRGKIIRDPDHPAILQLQGRV
jgi:hypothetical protein